MSVIIRSLEAKDSAKWSSMWTEYLKFYDSKVTIDIREMTFTRLIDPNQKVQNCLVAERNGNLIGLVHFIYHAHNWKIEDVCYLQDLFVDSKARGQGVGGALIEKVYATADLNGTPSVYWMTQDFNVNARVLYDRIGNLTPFIKYSR
jgi:GNAT superfamily N-acetyltransferase